MCDHQNGLVKERSLLEETEGSIASPAVTSGEGSDILIGELQRASGISHCQQPKRIWHYVSAYHGSVWICDLLHYNGYNQWKLGGPHSGRLWL
jgi:hypothetical protein